MADFVMPVLGADMEAGTLVAWLKQPGDRVERGDIVAEVETDKGLIEVEIFSSGVIERLVVAPGTRVPVGTVLAVVREDGAAPAAPRAPAVAAPSAAAVAAPATVAPPERRRRVSPAARKLAAERGVDVDTVVGTGPDGAVTREDVERAATPALVAAPVPPVDRSARMRQAIGAAMTRSKREIPHFYLATTIDLARALRWLADTNGRRPVSDRLLAGVLLVKATALALRDVPALNATWAGDHPVPSPAIHVGVAIALRGGGLVAPAVHDTDRLSVDQLMRSMRDLVERARAGRLRSSELSDSTITITSLGERGADAVYGVIFPPQVALVGFGRIVERPWAVDGAVGVHPVVTATLAADHRVTDGHAAGRFLATVDRLLQAPEAL